MTTTTESDRSPLPRRPRHPALGARIAAAGVSAATFLGIVAGLGIAGRANPADEVPVPVVVSAPSAVTIEAPSSDVVTLSAEPIVAVDASASRPAPLARTNGSR